MAGISVSFLTTNSFTVATDLTTTFNTGRRVRLTATSGYLYGNILSSSYSSPNTTVILTAASDNLDSSISVVYYGIAADSLGSLPIHSHDEENEGGSLTFINLSDTPVSYDDTKYLRSTASGTEWSTVSADHSTLNELDYASSGHIGFSPTSHSHTESDISDLDKYTEAEVDTISGSLNTKIDGKSDTGHTHDDRYYTESEIDTISGSLNTKIDGKSDTGHTHTESDISDLDKYTQAEVNTISGTLSDEIDSDIATHTSNSDAHHNESHTVVSHSDTTATGANLNELVGSGDTTLHKHDGQYYTESEVDTISGSLQTNIDGKPDTEVFLVEGVPSDSIGKENDIAVDQETGDVYEKSIVYGGSNSATFYPAVTADDGYWRDSGAVFGTSISSLVLGNSSGSWGSFCRFVNVTIPQGSNITNAYLKFVSYDNRSGTVNLNIYFNDSDDAVAPTSYSEVAPLVLTDSVVAWNGLPSWVDGTSYDSIDIKTIIQEVIDRSGWQSNNAAMFLIKDNGSSSNISRRPSAIVHASGSEKEELHITWKETTGELEWSKKLSPDFLKLSDTPTTYSGEDGKYLKTTTTGIEFSDDLYTKSEVDTISGSLQTSIDSMPVTLLELEDTPTTYSGSNGYYVKTTNSGIEFETNIYWKSYEPFLDENYANVKGVPTVVNRGLFKGYSMPIWADPSNVDEELLFRIRVPFRWDGVTDPWFCAITSLSAAEDIGDKYKFQLEWQSGDVGYVLPDTVAETLTDEITVANGTAYFAEIVVFEVGATTLVAGQNWQGRLRRIAASSSEVDNEPIVWHWCTRWKMNKLGTETTQGY